jgi:hypothetical protein
MPSGTKQTLECLGTEHPGEPLAIGTGWQVELGQGPAEGLDVEEADRRGGNITRTPSSLAFDQQVMERGTHLVGRQWIRGAVIISGSASDFSEIERLRPRGQAVQLHVHDHFGT